MLGVNLGVSWGRISSTSESNRRAIILANSFEARVLSDGGSFEALQCLINTIDSL